MHYVRSAKYQKGFQVLVEFEDGCRKVVDLEQHLQGPIFETLKDAAYFRLVSFNQDIETIVWPNGADFSPDFLYDMGQTVRTTKTSATPSRKPRPAARGRVSGVRK